MPWIRFTKGLVVLMAVMAVAAALYGVWDGEPGRVWQRRDDPAAGGTPPPAEVRIAFQTIPNGEAVVRHLGWLDTALEQRGIRVRWIDFASGSDVNAALASGDVDIGLVGSTLLATGIQRGVPYTLIWIHNVIGDNEALVVRDDGSIRSVADLVGKRVATPFGSTTHYTLLSALQDAGVSPRDVHLLDMKPQDIVAAWTRGDLDGAYVWEPTLSRLEDLGGRVLVSSLDLVDRGIVTADLGVVRTDFLRRHPDVVALYLQVQAEAVRWIQSDPHEAARTVAAAFGIEPDDALQQMEKVLFLDGCQQLSPAWLGRDIVATVERTGEFLHQQGLLPSVPPPEAIRAAVDPEPLRQAVGACDHGPTAHGGGNV